MSYDLAIWHGPRPPDDAAAVAIFARLIEASEEVEGIDVPAVPSLGRFITEMERRWPDDAADTPWASSPIRRNARGPFIYLNLRYDRPIDETRFVVAKAKEHALVCFDPQFSQLL